MPVKTETICGRPTARECARHRRLKVHVRLEPPSCALHPKKILVPAPKSVPTAIIFHFHHRLQATLLFSHQAHRSIAHLIPPIDAIENPEPPRPTAPRGGFLQVVVSKAPP